MAMRWMWMWWICATMCLRGLRILRRSMGGMDFGMVTPSVQLRNKNLTLYFGLVGQTSQSTAPMDMSHKMLGFFEMDIIIFMSRPGILVLHWAHRPILWPTSSSMPDPIKRAISGATVSDRQTASSFYDCDMTSGEDLKRTANGMTTLSVQCCDEDLILSFYLVGQMSQLTVPVDVAHKYWASSADHNQRHECCRRRPDICRRKMAIPLHLSLFTAQKFDGDGVDMEVVVLDG